MPKIPHPAKKKLSGSQAVSECLKYDETAPLTPPNMRKYRKQYNQTPGIKVIHYGLIDQKLPPSSHVYGIKLSKENVQSGIPQVTQMFSKTHQTELGKYIKDKDEINYKRHKLQRLGKTMDYGYNLPQKILNDDKFAFGVKSEKSQSGTKDLIEIDPNSKIPKTFSKMSMNESIKAEKEIVCKRNYHYDWNSLKVDPKTFVFGKPKKIINEQDKDKVESVANSLKFDDDKNNWNEPLNPIKKKPMNEDFIYGKINKDIDKNENVKMCIHSDIVEKKNILKRDLNENQNKINLHKIFGNKEYIQSRLNPKRISAKDLINPSKYAQEFTKNRDIDDIIKLYKSAGFESFNDEKFIKEIKEIITSKYKNICSLNEFNDTLLLNEFKLNKHKK